LDQSIENENQMFLNENSDNSDDNSDRENELAKTSQKIKNETETEKSQREAKNTQHANTASQLIDATIISTSSSDDDESSVVTKEPNDQQETQTVNRDLTHFCSYFKVTGASQAKCKHNRPDAVHSSSLKQNVCLNCEFANEINDTLDHMAFLSPSLKNEKPAVIELKFNSPTIEPSEKSPDYRIPSPEPVFSQVVSKNEELTTLADETNDEFNVSTSLIVDETLSDLEQDESSKSFSASVSNLSEATLVYSDSDYDEEKEVRDAFNLKKETRWELKRKRELENSRIVEEQDLFVLDTHFKTRYADGVTQSTRSAELWFCPCGEPPLASDLDGKFTASCEPIVSYTKSNDKFKLVIS
jgi:hypothetical protein